MTLANLSLAKHSWRLPVQIISDTTPVVALSRHVGDGVERHVVILVDEHLQLSDADPEVGLVEAVRDVPSHRAELTTLLHDRVEETQPE